MVPALGAGLHSTYLAKIPTRTAPPHDRQPSGAWPDTAHDAGGRIWR